MDDNFNLRRPALKRGHSAESEHCSGNVIKVKLACFPLPLFHLNLSVLIADEGIIAAVSAWKEMTDERISVKWNIIPQARLGCRPESTACRSRHHVGPDALDPGLWCDKLTCTPPQLPWTNRYNERMCPGWRPAIRGVSCVETKQSRKNWNQKPLVLSFSGTLSLSLYVMFV